MKAGKIERAMGYADEFTQKANEYKDQAEKKLCKERKEQKSNRKKE